MLSSIRTVEDLKKLDIKDLPVLADEVRQKIIEVMSKNGGHLASSLGTVELIIALHYVFDSPNDKFIFDVGHQSYTHKLLTGRYEQFDTIRKYNGLSGFPRRKESEHDLNDAGHSSTSISQALGFALTDSLSGKKNRSISIIGDGSLTGGVAFEGLNYAGHINLPLIVILNDNEMSIGQNVGAISDYINKIAVSKFYQDITGALDDGLKKSFGPFKAILRFINKLKRGFKLLMEYENVFTTLGFEYIGPIDGHNIKDLIYLFRKVRKNVNHPVLLHLKTIKGKGYAEAEGNPADFHGVSPYLMANNKEEIKNGQTFTDYFSKAMVDIAGKDEKVLAVTAAMESGTGLKNFALKYKERFFDVGIAEQHAVSFCSSLAYNGFRPVFAVYSTFLMRALDQVCQDVCISSANVVFAVDRAGIVGADGETHHGQFDISYLRMLPNISIFTPCDGKELEDILKYSLTSSGPVAIRYPRDIAQYDLLGNNSVAIEGNSFVKLKEGSETVVIGIGPFVTEIQSASDDLLNEGYDIGVIYIRQVKPLDCQKLCSEISSYKNVLVVEENVFSGSVSEYISATLLKMKLQMNYKSINLPDSFIAHGKRNEILNELGFSANNIVEIVKKF